jgi:hypothetical protein
MGRDIPVVAVVCLILAAIAHHANSQYCGSLSVLIIHTRSDYIAEVQVMLTPLKNNCCWIGKDGIETIILLAGYSAADHVVFQRRYL